MGNTVLFAVTQRASLQQPRRVGIPHVSCASNSGTASLLKSCDKPSIDSRMVRRGQASLSPHSTSTLPTQTFGSGILDQCGLSALPMWSQENVATSPSRGPLSSFLTFPSYSSLASPLTGPPQASPSPGHTLCTDITQRPSWAGGHH